MEVPCDKNMHVYCNSLQSSLHVNKKADDELLRFSRSPWRFLRAQGSRNLALLALRVRSASIIGFAWRTHGTPSVSCSIDCFFSSRYRGGCCGAGPRGRLPRVLPDSPLRPHERTAVEAHRGLLQRCAHSRSDPHGHGPHRRIQGRHWTGDAGILCANSGFVG